MWTQGALPYSKVRYVRLLRPPFYAHSSPNYPWKVRSAKDPVCFWVFDQKLQSHTMTPIFWLLIKKNYKFVQNIRNFSQISLWTCDKTHFVWNFWKDPNSKKYFMDLFLFLFLFCFVLFCFVLFCFVLFCFVLFCFVLICFVLFCFVLFCFVLFCFVLFFVKFT